MGGGIKDLVLYPQPPTNTRSPTLNSEEPLNGGQGSAGQTFSPIECERVSRAAMRRVVVAEMKDIWGSSELSVGGGV